MEKVYVTFCMCIYTSQIKISTLFFEKRTAKLCQPITISTVITVSEPENNDIFQQN